MRIIGSQEVKGENSSTSAVAPNNEQQTNDVKATEVITNTQPASVTIPTTTAAVSVHEPPLSGYPTVICVIGKLPILSYFLPKKFGTQELQS